MDGLPNNSATTGSGTASSLHSTTGSIDDLCRFLDDSPSPFHVVNTVANQLGSAGFAEFTKDSGWGEHNVDRGFVRRDGALIAWKLGAKPTPARGFRLVGAHTDSPTLRVTPHPDVRRHGWHQLHVEVYGGILRNSWLDRDLGLAGRVVGADGAHALVRTELPVARIPQLAIHLDRGVNDALTLNPQEHLRPLWSIADQGGFSDWLAAISNIDSPLTWEIGLYDQQPAAIVGADRSILASGRLDNQVSCWAAMRALIAAEPIEHIAVIVLNDHEEVGSVSPTGADGPWLGHILERLALQLGWDRDRYLAALSTSVMVSADNAHAIHPNYADRHEPRHAPLINAGPVVKTNVNQRYATTAPTAARFIEACEATGVAYQVFASKNTMPCGSTIGPLSAGQLGIDVVDVGIPQLSMHSAREMCGTDDPPALYTVLTHLMSA